MAYHANGAFGTACSPLHALASSWFQSYTATVQVTLNQLALAPVVLAAVFTWNLVLQRQHRSVPQKLRHDLLPTMTTGQCWLRLTAMSNAQQRGSIIS